MTADEIISSTCYFWEEKGDLERCVSWREMKVWLRDHHPDVLTAWENYKQAQRILTLEIKAMTANHIFEEDRQ